MKIIIMADNEIKDRGRRWRTFKNSVTRCDLTEFSKEAEDKRQLVIAQGQISTDEFDFSSDRNAPRDDRVWWRFPSGNPDWLLEASRVNWDNTPQKAMPRVIIQEHFRRVYHGPINGDLVYTFRADFTDERPFIAQSVDFSKIRSQKNSLVENHWDSGRVERIRCVSLTGPEGFSSHATITLRQKEKHGLTFITATPNKLWFDDGTNGEDKPLTPSEIAQLGVDKFLIKDRRGGTLFEINIDGDTLVFFLSLEMVPGWWRFLIDKGNARMSPVTKSTINLPDAQLA